MTNNNVLIVEDEPRIRHFLRMALEGEGIRVMEACSIAHGVTLMSEQGSVGLVILDLGLPDGDGVDFIRIVRDWSTVPILVLSARNLEADKVNALDAGADDYLAKPFTPRELVARIQAILRRQRLAMQPVAPHKLSSHSDTVSFGDFVLNLETQTLTRNGEVLPLSSTEFLLLRAFVANAGRTLGRERLIELTRGRDCEASDRSIDVQVLRLRRLLETDTSNPQFLRTVWGSGYVFIPEGKAEHRA